MPGWPQFPRPTRLPDGRAWTAVFDSYDQRRDDVYYYMTVVEEGRDPASFFVRVTVPPEGEGSSGALLRSSLREELNRLADEGRTNTDYEGSLVGGQAAAWLKARRKQARTPAPAPGPGETGARGRFYLSANGRLSFEMETEPTESIFPLLSFLDERFGLKSGFPVFGLDGVYCDGTAGPVKIAVGYDNWSGVFLQAFDEAGDELVRAMGDALNAREDAGAEPTPSRPPVPAAGPSVAATPLAEPPPAAKPVRVRRVPASKAAFAVAVESLAALSRLADASRVCILPSEEAGFEETPFEAETAALIRDAIVPALRRHPEWLTGEGLASLLRSALDLRPAVKAYRARLLSSSGDYDNEFSPLAGPVRAMVEALAAAVASGGIPFDGLPADLPDAGLTLFAVGPDGRIETDARTVRERLSGGR